MSAGEKSRLRREHLERRSGLTRSEATLAAARVAHRIWTLPPLARTQRLALYFPLGGELDCTPIITRAWRRGREVFLPVLRRSNLAFARFTPDTVLTRNRFGIPEPSGQSQLCDARDLDVIIAPLVAFDSTGRRLGMGGGYYDRTLAFLSQRRFYRRPHFVGVAFDFQRITTLPTQRWDIHLDAVVTDADTYRFR